MVSDASSGDGRGLELERDKAPTKAGDLAQSRSTADLTHELAQLLAATIAQRQLNLGLPASQAQVNLAGLSAQQRILEPAFRDGLSALAYKMPRGTSLVPSVDLSADDEPMPIPSTWREPPAADGDRWLRQQMGATLLGLCAGLLVVVPIVLWLSGWLGDAQKSRSLRTAAEPSLTPIEPRSGDVKTVKVQVRPVERTAQAAAQYVTGSIDARPTPEPPRPVETAAIPMVKAPQPVARVEPPPRPPVDDRLAEAKQRIESGDVSGARDILTGAEGSAPGPVSFALAETYDPNMLAAWGTRGAIADVARAKALYHKSLGLGMARAQARLDALQ
ncbi:MAG TPA: hypothetical protein VKF35_06675 [Hyphomicrobiaceae bacterium]|nr:hypothetical protein [Hyphomicrobiaceae bacterium]